MVKDTHTYDSKGAVMEQRNWATKIFIFSLHGTLFLAITGVLVAGVPAYRFLLPLLAVTFFSQGDWVDTAAGVMKNRLFIPLWAWLAFALLSLLWVQDFSLAVRNIYFLALGIGLIIIFHVRPEQAKKLVLTVAAAAAVIVIIGVVEHFTGFHLPMSIYYGSGSQIPTSVFHNPNDFAFFLSLYAWLFVALANATSGKLLGVASWLVFASAIILVPLTRSRGAMLALAIQVAVLTAILCVKALLHILRKERGKGVASQVRMSLLAIAIIAALCLVLLSSMDSAKSIFPFLEVLSSGDINYYKEGIQEIFGVARWNLAQNGFAMLRDSNYLGVGAGNVEAYMGQYSQTHYSVGRLVNVHNWWIEVPVNYGLPGLILYGMFVLNIFWGLLKVVVRRDRNSILGVAGIVALAGFVFSAMSPSSIMAIRPHWVMYGLLSVLSVPGFFTDTSQNPK